MANQERPKERAITPPLAKAAQRPRPGGPLPYRPFPESRRGDDGSLSRTTMINQSPPPRHLDASFDELLQRIHDCGRLLTQAAGSEGHHKLISDSGVALFHGVPLVTSTTR